MRKSVSGVPLRESIQGTKKNLEKAKSGQKGQGGEKRSQKRDSVSSGFYSAAFRRFLHSISPRAFAIASARYGASGKEPMTLEEIGQTYSITRERIRQIIFALLGNVRAKRYPSSLEEVSKKIEWTLKKGNGILPKEVFFSSIAGNNLKERGAVRFFLAVLSDRFRIDESESLAPSVALASFSMEEWQRVNDRIKALFVEKGVSIPEAELLKQLSHIPELKGYDGAVLLDFLAVSQECARNPFGQWGLPEWSDICPRGTRDRAYLVVRDEGKPLHFREIAKKIDRSGLQKPGKVTHPQTVHNELIKDSRFVLVGRGTYALVEWGYRRGTVRELVESMLREKQGPLTRAEIIKEILKIRDVKEATIAINLNSFFARGKNDTYDFKENAK